MENQRNTLINQAPRPQPPTQHFANEFPFQSLSPVGFNNTQQIPFNLSQSIDVDQSLSNALFSLSLSQNNHTGGRAFLPNTIDSEYGGVVSPIGGEGFISPFLSNTGFEEGLRVSNDVNNHQRVYYGASNDNPLTVDPLDYQNHQRYPPLMCYNREFLQGACSSGFDPWLDSDQRSYLLAKERLYYLQHLDSYHNPLDQSFSNNLNLSWAGVSSVLQNRQILSQLPLNELRGMICYLSKDQNGCRILQSMFENPTEEDIELVFSGVLGSIADLMKDQFANYLIQKLVSLCNDDQKVLIIRELTEAPIEIILVSMSPYGTRAIQNLLENLKDPNQILMVIRALHRAAAKLANDPNGHHVIQYCLLHFDSNFNQPILEEIAKNCFKVATDRSGCVVLQACVEHSRGQIRNRLVAQILANAIQLAEDPFGNYVLQHMVGLQLPELTEVLVRQLQGSFASLSRNKYASNLVEKCLIKGGPEISTNIILELVGTPDPLLLLIDPFGNFVIQSALKVSTGFVHECLRKLITRNAASMQSNIYGLKILEKIEKKKFTHT